MSPVTLVKTRMEYTGPGRVQYKKCAAASWVGQGLQTGRSIGRGPWCSTTPGFS
jgi:hypothetical protein